MKVAIFHTAMDNIGGAEIVGLALARELDADFYSTNIDFDKIQLMGFADVKMISIGRIPINAPYRQQLALARFRRLNLKDKYDFYIIDGDWAVSGAVNHQPNLWYVHSPIREIWDLHDYTRKNSVAWPLRWVFDLWVRYNRHLNRQYVNQVERLVCNSKTTQNRISKYLSREARVIHPPIETSRYHYRQNGNYWLSVNRLVGHKRVDVQIEAFRQLPEEKLIIVGSYEQSKHFKKYVRYINQIKPENVEIRSWVTFDELIELYADCKAFITTAKEEDFGMTAVEAMAAGKPVIAPNEGGYKETVIHGQTGYHLPAVDAEHLLEAMKIIGDHPQQYKEACLQQAAQFDTKNFINKIKEEMMHAAPAH